MKDLEPFPGKLHRGKRRRVLLFDDQRRWLAVAIREYPLSTFGRRWG